MPNGARILWDRLARADPLLATEGYNACAGYRSREELGTPVSAGRWFRPSPGERVLDLGCGWGKMARQLAAPVALDLSLPMLEACRAAGVERLVCAEAARLPFAGGSFDHVWSHSMLMHLPRAEVLRVLDEVARVLRPGGQACLHFKNRRHPTEILLALRGGLAGGARHPQRRRGADPGWLVRQARRRFGEVRIVAESWQLLPLSVPRGGTRLDVLGVPAAREVSFRHPLPLRWSRRARALFDWLRDRANDGWPALAPYAKELLLLVGTPIPGSRG